MYHLKIVKLADESYQRGATDIIESIIELLEVGKKALPHNAAYCNETQILLRGILDRAKKVWASSPIVLPEENQHG